MQASKQSERAEILESVAIDTTTPITCDFNTDELTAHCPFDFGGPDHYTLTIRYRVTDETVESKSLKKYIESYRDAEITAEDLAAKLHADIDAKLSHEGLYIELTQNRRGGITETVEVGNESI